MKMKRMMGFLLLLVGLLVGCGSQLQRSEIAESPYKPEDMIRVTFVNPMMNNPYWDMIQKGVEDAASEYDVDVKVTGSKNTDIESHTKALETAIAAQVDAIVTVAYDSKSFISIINRAVDAGIYVVLVDTDSPDSERSLYIGTQNWRAGYLAGKTMARAMDDQATIGIITGSFEQSNLNERIGGFQDAVGEYECMEVVSIMEGNSDRLKIEEQIERAIQEHPDLNAIFCTEGYGAVGVGKALEQNDEELLVIGFDDVPETLAYIEDGIVYGTIVQEPYRMGYLSIQSIYDLESGGIVQDIHTRISVLDQSTITQQ